MESGVNLGERWHYEWKGERVGPVSDVDISEKVSSGLLSGEALVWNEAWEGKRGWEKVKNTGFGSKLSYSGPPPIPADKINNSFAWALVGVQALGTLIEVVFQQSMPGSDSIWIYATIIYFVINSALALKDSDNLAKSGYDVNIKFWFWIIPVYLYKRAKSLGQSLKYFWAWIAAAILSMLLMGAVESSDTYFGVGTPSCSSSSVTKLVKEVFGDIPAAKSQGIHPLGVVGISEVRASDAARVCEASIPATDGHSYLVEYEVTDYGDEFYVDLEVIR